MINAAGMERKIQIHTYTTTRTHMHTFPNQHFQELSNTHKLAKAVTNTFTNTDTLICLCFPSLHRQLCDNSEKQVLYMCIFRFMYLSMCVCVCVLVRHLTHGPSVFLDPFCHSNTSQCK